jgi:hypothetical protein
MTRRLCDAWLCALILLGCAGPVLAQQHDHGSEFEVFLAAEAIHGTEETHAYEDDDTWFNADVVFGLTQHQFRVFGEYYITPSEHDLERLQFGFEFVPETTLWAGRFHQPASAWNTEHHHGRYLQTAITRPFIERWEDEGGLIPQHITGALLESRRPLGQESALQLSVGVGAGPGLTESDSQRVELTPVDLIGSNPGRHRLSITSRLAYLPEYVGASSTGLLYGHDDLSTQTPQALSTLGSSNLTLNIVGAYLDWYAGPWRFIGVNYYVDIDLLDRAHKESFDSFYLQVERQLPYKLTVFGRFEDSARMQESTYVATLVDNDGDIDVAVRREALGLRWDFARRQALTVELSHITSLPNIRANEVRLQWSGVVP